jgi:hypothetical protein
MSILKRVLPGAILALCLIFSLATTAVLAASPAYLRHTFYGSGDPDRAYGVATDSTNNSIIVGRSKNTWNGQNDQPPKYDHSSPGDNPDIFLLKLDANGNYLWHAFFGTSAADYGMAVVIDSHNNIYVTGFSGASWNGPSNQPPKHSHSGGYGDAFVLKLNSAGDYQWHTFYGSGTWGEDRDEGHAIAVDSQDNLYVAIRAGDDWTDPSGAKNGYTGGQEMAVLKLDGQGIYQWHTFFGGDSSQDDPSSIAVDGSDVYIAGISSNAWVVGPQGSQKDGLNAYTGGDDIAVVKLDTSGVYQWHTFYGSSLNDGANGVAASGGSVYVTGYSFDTWSGPGPTAARNAYSGAADIVALKLNDVGTYQWHTFYGSATNDDFGLDLVLSVSGSRVDIVGRSLAAWTNGGSGPVHSYAALADLTVLEVSNEGTYQWHTFYGSAETDLGQDIAIDGRGYLHAVGTSAASWNGDGNATPKHGYTGTDDIYEIVLGSPLQTPVQGVGGEVRPVSQTELFRELFLSNRMTVVWTGLISIFVITVVFLVMKRSFKP